MQLPPPPGPKVSTRRLKQTNEQVFATGSVERDWYGFGALDALASAAFTFGRWRASEEQLQQATAQTAILGKQLEIARTPVLHLTCSWLNQADKVEGLAEATTAAFPIDDASVEKAFGKLHFTEHVRTWHDPWGVQQFILCELRNFGSAAVTDVSLHFGGDFFRGNTYGPDVKILQTFYNSPRVSLAANGSSVQRYIFQDPTCFSLSIHPPDTATARIPPGDAQKVVPVQMNQSATEAILILAPAQPPKTGAPPIAYCTGV